MDAFIHVVCPAVIPPRFITKKVFNLVPLRVQDQEHRGPPHWAPGSLLSPITHQGCPLALAGHVLQDRGLEENQPRYSKYSL